MSSTFTIENLQRFAGGQFTSENPIYHYFYLYEVALVGIVENVLIITVNWKIKDNRYPYGEKPEWIKYIPETVKLDLRKYNVSSYFEKICLKYQTTGEICYLILSGSAEIIKIDNLEEILADQPII